MSRSVVITGVGAVTPLGVGAHELIERWTAGESGIEDGLGRCDQFEPGDVLSKKEAHRTDRFTQLAVAACQEAVEDAGWDEELPYAPECVGCVVGTGIGGLATIEQQHTTLVEDGERALSP